MGKFLYDISRDKGSDKISTTKIVGLTGSIMLFILFAISMYIMIKTMEIDHVLVGEMMGFVLTLLGFKNGFGFNKTTKKDEGGIKETKIDISHRAELNEGIF